MNQQSGISVQASVSRSTRVIWRRRLLMIPVVTLTTAGCGGPPPPAASNATEPIALVETEVILRQPLAETVRGYGLVVPAPGAVRVLTAPFESMVEQVHVSVGQTVGRAEVLLVARPSQDSQLLIEQAEAAERAERGRMEDAVARLELGMITRDELLLQEQALDNAATRWSAYQPWTAGRRITSPTPGVVQSLAGAEGQRVPAGDALAIVAVEGQFEVELGIEPSDAALVRPGQTVLLTHMGSGTERGGSFEGQVRTVGRQVDPQTRLASLRATINGSSPAPLLGAFVRADIVVQVDTGLVVPRKAVLPGVDGNVIFVVKNGRAFLRSVDYGIATDSLVQVVGADVNPGDSVVVLGNYELSDSMKVRLVGDSLAPPTSADSTSPRPKS